VSPRGRQYGFDRRRRDTARRQKQQAKRERKLTRTAEGVTGPDIDAAPQETGAPTGVWEWFSPSRGRVVSSSVGVRPESDPPDDWVLMTDASAGNEDEDEAPSPP